MKSKFDGSLISLIGISILQLLLIIVTLGIGTPWAVCMRERWYAKHTVIDGRQLYFDGTGGQLFGKYILWLFLTIITIGIYGLWLGIKMKAWVVSHTHSVPIGGGEPAFAPVAAVDGIGASLNALSK